MLTIEKCKEILGDAAMISDEELTKVRDFMYELAEWEIEILSSKNQKNEKSNSVRKGIK